MKQVSWYSFLLCFEFYKSFDQFPNIKSISMLKYSKHDAKYLKRIITYLLYNVPTNFIIEEFTLENDMNNFILIINHFIL